MFFLFPISFFVYFGIYICPSFFTSIFASIFVDGVCHIETNDDKLKNKESERGKK